MRISIFEIGDEYAAAHSDSEDTPCAVPVGSFSPADSNVARPPFESR
jgi:hypothetical protein